MAMIMLYSNQDWILKSKNVLEDLLTYEKALSDVIHVIRTKEMEVYSDIISQTVICK